MKKFLSLFLVVMLVVITGLLVELQAQVNSLDNARFNVVGNSASTNRGVFTLTDFQKGATAAAWYKDVVNLGYDFDFTFAIQQWGRADGMVFVMQQDGNDLFSIRNGGTLGYYNDDKNNVLYNRSVGVEFDLFNNKGNWSDKAKSHIALVKNKNPEPIEGPFYINPRLNSGEENLVRIVWQADSKQFSLYLNNALLFTHVEDFTSTVFGQNPSVFIGFTAATGDRVSRQQFTARKLSVSRSDYLTFQLSGTAYSNGGNCITMTTPLSSAPSAAWYKNAISLQEDFDVSFNTTQKGEGDGMVFVLQQDGPRAFPEGYGGGGDLGYFDVAAGGNSPLFNRSVGIEMDIYQNDASYNDPNNSHISLVKNKKTTPIKGPFTIQTNLGNGVENECRIVWKASTKELSYYLNGTLIFTHKEDFTNTVFDKNPLVYFGFTASTGNAHALQTICAKKLTVKAIPQALEQLGFSGSWYGQYPELNWSTLNETNTQSFNLQRSTDGVVYTKVTQQNTKGAGNNNYTHTDNSWSGGEQTLYYRLQVVDKLGYITLSPIVKLKQRIVDVNPNPNNPITTPPTPPLPTTPIPNPPVVTPTPEIEFPSKLQLSLSGNWQGNTPSLLWKTTGERGISQYKLQRSTDRIRFITITTVIAKGNGDFDYPYTDETAAGLNAPFLYYRVQAVDKQGSATNSNVVTLSPKPKAEPGFKSNIKMNLTGTWENPAPSLVWQTQGELNIAYFTLERSTDRVRFTSVTKINSKGNGDFSYPFNDEVAAGLNAPYLYYRVQAVDKQGSATTSNVVTLTAKPKAEPGFKSNIKMNLTGTWENPAPTLVWQTQGELNIAYFSLERSTDRVRFTSVTKINSKGNGDFSYPFNDEVAAGLNAPYLYFRVQAVDKQGSATTSNIVTLTAKPKAEPEFKSNIKMNLTGTWENPAPSLVWQTQGELNIAYFTLERSTDRVRFTSVTKINSKGNGDFSYPFNDEVAAGLNAPFLYYRVQAVDKQGSATTSNIVTLTAKPKAEPEFKSNIKMNLTGTWENPAPSLVWQTHGELNIAYFSLERSTDRVRFTSLTKINSKGNGDFSYPFNDEVAAGLNAPYLYYRVQAVDKQGSATTSNVVTLTAKPKAEPEFKSNIKMNLTGTWENPAPTLVWQTQGELNIAYFSLERSTDRVRFTSVNKINSKGNGDFSYPFNDEVAAGLNAPFLYYRVQAVDKQGSATTSNIVTLTAKPKAEPEFKSNIKMNLTGTWENPAPTLVWQTQGELNIAYFSLERSTDRVRFTSVTKINSKGNGDFSYPFNDEVAAGLNAPYLYYRVQAVDKQGSATTSNVVTLTARKKAPSEIPELGSAPLATLIDFTARPYKDSILLQWRTSNETNSTGMYEIQKSTDNGRFIKIAQIPAKNQGNNNYRCFDEKAQGIVAPKVIYRLFVADKKGQLTLLKELNLSPTIDKTKQTN